MTPRAGLTCARIVRGARPSVQALLGGAEFSHSRPATTAYTATPVQGDNSSANKRGPVTWVSSQGFHADDPELLSSLTPGLPPQLTLRHQSRGTTRRPTKGPGYLGILPGFPCR